MKFLHVGDNIILFEREIIGIFGNISQNSRVLEEYRKRFLIRNESKKNRSFLPVKKEGKESVYFSKITSRKLIRRANARKEEQDGEKEKRE